MGRRKEPICLVAIADGILGNGKSKNKRAVLHRTLLDKPYCKERCLCSQIKYHHSTEDLLVACNEIALSLK